MERFAIFCPLVLFMSYAINVWGVERGEVFDLIMAQKKIYDPVRIYTLEWSLQFTQERDNVRLRYDGMSMFTIMSNRGDTEFFLSDIFFILRNIVGIISKPSNENILLKFVNERDARAICLERYSFERYSSNDFEVETVLAIDNLMNVEIQVNEILHNGAICVVNLEYSSSDNFETAYHEFAIHPTGNGPKPPIALFVTELIRVRRGPKSNFLVMEHEVRNGAFYFGLIFSSDKKIDKFLNFLIGKKVVDQIPHSGKIEAITAKLFENYQ